MFSFNLEYVQYICCDFSFRTCVFIFMHFTSLLLIKIILVSEDIFQHYRQTNVRRHSPCKVHRPAEYGIVLQRNDWNADTTTKKGATRRCACTLSVTRLSINVARKGSFWQSLKLWDSPAHIEAWFQLTLFSLHKQSYLRGGVRHIVRTTLCMYNAYQKQSNKQKTLNYNNNGSRSIFCSSDRVGE